LKGYLDATSGILGRMAPCPPPLNPPLMGNLEKLSSFALEGRNGLWFRHYRQMPRAYDKEVAYRRWLYIRAYVKQ